MKNLTSIYIVGLLVVGLAVPASAAQKLKSDPVEAASATLSQTISSHKAEQTQLMQMRAQEFALMREGVFSQPLQDPSVKGSKKGKDSVSETLNEESVVIAGKNGPSIPEAEALNASTAWLLGQNDSAITGFIPVAGREGLLVSYSIPPADPLAFLAGRAWTYDNAVGAIALLLQNQPSAAKEILSSLQGLMAPNGTLSASYQVDTTFADGRVWSGNMAWVGYAMALYQRETGDSTFQVSAEKIGAYLKTLQVASGSIKGSAAVNWVSTEHNIDAYFFYRELYRVTGNGSYQTTANQIKNSLLTNHWTGTAGNGHFLQGINDSVAALDANSWGAVFLWAIGKKNQANAAMTYVENTFKNTKTYNGVSVTGYSPDAAKQTVWVEGSLGVAAAYQRLGKKSNANGVINQMAKLKTASGAYLYAAPRYTNPDGDTYSDLESVASTGWHQIALDLLAGGSSFWNAD